ncbi:MAG: hypothetical protein RL757_904 [Bacteroidota bacterium]|jgi:LPXTG-motif cell wall-anchored protein
MIQRIQTVFLGLATLILAATFLGGFFSYAKNVSNDDANQIIFHQTGNSEPTLMLIAIIAMLFAAIAIFLFKNRKMQSTVAGISLLCATAWEVVAIWRTRVLATEQPDHTISFYGGLVAGAVAVLLIALAIRAIRADENLVKSADRLR